MFESLSIREKPIEKASEPGELYSPNTIKVYQSALNTLSDALGYTTVNHLLVKKKI